jgi:hypothetical protein
MLTAGAQGQKRRPPKRPPQMLISIVALPPSIEVPRTIPVGLTDAALHRPTRSAAIPCAAAVVIVIAMVVSTVPISRRWQHAANTN